MLELSQAKAARFFALSLEAGSVCMADVRAWAREVLTEMEDAPGWLADLAICPDRRRAAAMGLLRAVAEPGCSLETALAVISQLDYAFRVGQLDGRACVAAMDGMMSRGELPEDFQYLAFLLEHTYEAVAQGRVSERRARTEIGRHLGRYASFDDLVPVERQAQVVRFVPAMMEHRAAM